MKTITALLIILFFIPNTFCQTLSKGDYLLKSKSQKTTGWILLGGGTAIAIAGTISMSNQDFWSSDNSDYDTAGFMMLGGLAVGLASIPFFISSAKNANKAATISFNYQKAYFPKHDIFVVKMQPAITLKIPL